MEVLERSAHEIDCVLTDIYMPGISGMDLLMHVREHYPDLPVIMLTGKADVNSAVGAMRAGAYDYLVKPIDTGETLAGSINRALTHHRLLARNRYLEERLELSDRFGGMVGESPAMLRVFEVIDNVAVTDATVLILGESGTGKELVARSIHDKSKRSKKRFVAVNCGALTETLLESELFGHERGAFTGADSKRKGLFEEASGGTLFLDEVGEMSLATQVKLLRALQEGQVRPVGANKDRAVDVRVIAATNRNLKREIEQKRFREDLYYRLNVINVELPPLRSRGDDVITLAHHMLAKHASRMGRKVRGFEPDAIELLQRHDWPGNVRELENALERAVIMTDGETITAASLPGNLRSSASPGSVEIGIDSLSFAEARAQFERHYLSRILDDCEGNVSQAAKKADMDRSNFRRLLQRHGVSGALDKK